MGLLAHAIGLRRLDGDYLALLPGDVQIEVPSLNLNLPEPGFFKQQFDQFWSDPKQQAQIKQQILKNLPTLQHITIQNIFLADAGRAELRVVSSGDEVRLKYVVHGNVSPLDAFGESLVVTFDIEVALALPFRQKSPIQASHASGFAHHFDIKGGVATADFAMAFFKSYIHEGEAAGDATAQDVKGLVNQSLARIAAPIPPGTPVLLSESNGTTQMCVQMKPADVCKFPAVATPVVPSRQKLDTSHDQCGESAVWIWDYQLGRFVRLATGQRALIPVEQRFEWFCGGDTAPDGGHNEWTVGPIETYLVSVSRQASGQLDWTFLSWK